MTNTSIPLIIRNALLFHKKPMRKIILYISIFYSITSLAQVPSAETGKDRIAPISIENSQANRIYVSDTDKQYLDAIDTQWSERLNETLLYNDYASNNKDIIKTVDPLILKNRLEKLNNKTPLDIEYNDVVDAYVQKYLKMGPWVGKVMGLAEYYFPLFEARLAKYNIPLEIKYLAIVESTLNPRAGSHKGAIGLWQFIHSTGKLYDLEINSYVDERMDPLKSTEAACQYLVRHYDIYGDWNLVLAAYNSGAGNVNKAIKRSGGYKNYWNIRRFLPRETQGYIPSFIAMTYLFEYAKEHNLKPNRLDVSFYETDTVWVKNKLSFSEVSKFTGVPYEKVEFLNPQYKNDYVPRRPDKQYALRLPKENISRFVSQENYIYAMTVQAEKDKEQPEYKKEEQADQSGTFTIEEVTRQHIVKESETIESIAHQYGVEVVEILKWNNLSSSKLSKGQELTLHTKIKKYKESTPVSTVKTEEPKSSAKPESKKTTVTPKERKQSYTIREGETLGEIASKFDVSQSDIKIWNDLKSSTLYVGQKLTIYSNKVVKDKAIHKVRKGENLGVIADQYNVSVSDLKNWNGLRSSNLSIGQKLVIYGKSSGSSSKASSSKPKNGPVYHTVKSGESLYTIAKDYPGISADNIKTLNGLKSSTLKVGQKLLIKK